MYNHLYSNNLLYKYQSGFRPGHSTTFQLIDIFHHICQSFDEKQYSCMVFCDISKAFDKVWHRGLLFKLRQKGIKSRLLAWISNYFSARKQRVQINSATSSLQSINAGVPPGSVLGPLLFLVYVNDIAKKNIKKKNSLVRLFVDDCSLLLFFSATNLRDIEGVINHDLALIAAWAKKWLVDFNPIKTVAMLFSLRPVDYLPSLNFNNTDISFVENHKHLGITFPCNGQWMTYIETIINTAYRTLGIMKKLKYSFSRLALNQMYISYIRPLLEYSSILWDGCLEQDKAALERLQNEIARIVTGLTRFTSIANLYTECVWDSLANRKNCASCINVPTILSQIISPTSSLRMFAKSLTITYVIVISLLTCIPAQKYLVDLASYHLCLTGTVFSLILERQILVYLLVIDSKTQFLLILWKVKENCLSYMPEFAIVFALRYRVWSKWFFWKSSTYVRQEETTVRSLGHPLGHPLKP